LFHLTCYLLLPEAQTIWTGELSSDWNYWSRTPEAETTASTTCRIAPGCAISTVSAWRTVSGATSTETSIFLFRWHHRLACHWINTFWHDAGHRVHRKGSQILGEAGVRRLELGHLILSTRVAGIAMKPTAEVLLRRKARCNTGSSRSWSVERSRPISGLLHTIYLLWVETSNFTALIWDIPSLGNVGRLT
jgi:hypothetical protein